MKKNLLLSACLVTLFFLSATAQVKCEWGNIDTRYAVEKGVVIKTKGVSSATAWRGERVNFQLLVQNSGADSQVTYSFTAPRCGKSVIPVENVVEGFVQPVITDKFTGCGYHDVEANGCNLSADRICGDATTLLESNTARGMWLTVQVPQNVKAGTYKGGVTVTADGKSKTYNYTINVLNRVLPQPAEWRFHLDLWQNPYAVARVHNVDLWSPEHFEVLRPYMLKLAAAGQKVITATLTHKPWNGQTYDPFGSMVTWVKKADGSWWYDFTIFDKWVEFMMDCGIDKEITCFSMIPWQLSFRYYDQASDSHKEIKCAPGEDAYAEFWGGMLKAFSQHLKEKGWFEKTFISMDERSLEQMTAAIKVIKTYAPGMKISMAGLYHPEIEADITDYCLDIENYKSYTPELLARRRSEGKISTYYTCCSAEYPNLFTFTDPADAEFIALEALVRDLDGYLRWAYNSWTAEPEKDSRFTAWPAGDTYVIYPFSVSSVRWERLVQGIQQFEKYKILLDEAQSKGDKAKVARLKKILDKVDISRIAAESEKMVKEFRDGLNRM